MAAVEPLPIPHLDARRFGARCIPMLTDEVLYERTGVRIAFTGRAGGVSAYPYEELNLGSHVGDDPVAVRNNRALVLEALGAAHMPLIVPNQVHGEEVVCVRYADSALLEKTRSLAQAGADALAVSVADVAALLCFADCVPLIVVSPTGRFAVIHAGWRGVMNGIAPKAVRMLAEADGADAVASAAAGYNIYLGPHIHVECFETGEDVRASFVERFGNTVAKNARHIDLLAALTISLQEAGVVCERIADAGICTKCSPDSYFSYRASQGVCGRHAAMAFRHTEQVNRILGFADSAQRFERKVG